MRAFVQFYHKSTGYKEPVRLIEACGSDSVLKLDGRLSLQNMIERARQRADELRNVQKYEAFKVMRSIRMFGKAKPLTELIYLCHSEIEETG